MIETEKYKHASYLGNALRQGDIKQAVETCVETLAGKRFDTIAFRGMSGALIAPIVAHTLGKEIILIRKKTEDYTNSNEKVEGHLAAKEYVILDDFICSGDTVREIMRRVKRFAPQAELVGGAFYTHYLRWLTAKDLLIRVDEE